MRWLTLAVVFAPLLCLGQAGTTAVTMQVQDINGDLYANCQWSVVFVGQSTAPGTGPYTPAALLNGQQGRCDSFGNLSINLADNLNTVTPTPSQWQFNICSGPGYVSGPYCSNSILVTISGATQNLTSTVKAAMPVLPAVTGTNLTPGTPAGALQLRSSVATFAAGTSPLYASQAATGTDCGAKINAQDTALGANAGEVWVDNNCGTSISTAVSIGANHVLRFIQGGTYTFSAGITLGANSLLSGTSISMAVNTTPSVVLQMSNSANLAAMVTMSGSFAAIQDIVLDGNRTHNGSAGPALIVNSSRAEISRVTVINSNSDGVKITSSANSIKIFKLMSAQNNGNGLNCVSAPDGFVSNSEFETSVASNGMLLSDCAGWRIEHNDFGGNNLYGLVLQGSVSGSSNTIINGNQFGNQVGGDLDITGAQTFDNVIVGNEFIGSSSYSGTQSELVIFDSGINTIVGNYFASLGGNQTQYAISATEGSPGVAGPNVVGLNTLNGTFAGVIAYNSVQTVGGFESQFPTSGVGAVDLFDVTASAATPHKYFRVSAGKLQILSSSFANQLLTLSDSGVLSLPSAPGNQIVFSGIANSVSLNAVNPSVPRIYSMIDPGANANFGLTFNTAGAYQSKKNVSGCTTGVAAGNNCASAITVTWPAAFADSNYSVACTGYNPTNVPSGPYIVSGTKGTASVQVNYFAITAAAAAYASVDCIAVHD